MSLSSSSRLWMRDVVASSEALSCEFWRSAASRWRRAPSVVTGGVSLWLRWWWWSQRLEILLPLVFMQWRVLSCSTNMARTKNLRGIMGFWTASTKSPGESLLQSMLLHIWDFWSSVILPL